MAVPDLGRYSDRIQSRSETANQSSLATAQEIINIWCRGYYVDTVGKNTAAIKKYIQNQLKEDLEYDQMSLVEYIDPFTGEPVKKNKK